MEATAAFKFRKLSDSEKIQLGDFHSLDNGKTMETIKHYESIGLTPKDFYKDRSFWRILNQEW